MVWRRARSTCFPYPSLSRCTRPPPSTRTPPRRTSPGQDNKAMQGLMALGFSREQCYAALCSANGDKLKAANTLLDSQQTPPHPARTDTPPSRGSSAPYDTLPDSTPRSMSPDDAHLCPICIENPKDCALNPCGHRFCRPCANRIKAQPAPTCAICRTKFKTILQT